MRFDNGASILRKINDDRTNVNVGSCAIKTGRLFDLDGNKFSNGKYIPYPCLSFFRRVNIYSLLSTWINILFIETRTVNLAVYLFSKSPICAQCFASIIEYQPRIED